MPPLECAVKCTRLGEAQQVTDLARREGRVREQPFGGAAASEIDNLLVGHALGREAALQSTRRHRELPRYGVNIRRPATKL